MPQINVKVIARASRCEIIPFNDGLKVKLTSPAVEGKANEQLCALLADYWHVPKKNVRILSGEHSSIKRIEWLE